jgi:hypothetical protein
MPQARIKKVTSLTSYVKNTGLIYVSGMPFAQTPVGYFVTLAARFVLSPDKVLYVK